MPTEKTWQEWLERLFNLRRDKRGSHERPHKPVLLLAILELLDRNLITRNEIPLTPDLVNAFKRYFAVEGELLFALTHSGSILPKLVEGGNRQALPVFWRFCPIAKAVGGRQREAKAESRK
jgi:hypothetical protein